MNLSRISLTIYENKDEQNLAIDLFNQISPLSSSFSLVSLVVIVYRSRNARDNSMSIQSTNQNTT
jgi:hypothetical protein